MNEPYRFNDDLLMTEADEQAAAQMYPRVAYALNHPALREWFAKLDATANLAKRRSRIFGVSAVALVTLALFIAAGEPLYRDDHHFSMQVGAVGAVIGLVGVALGFTGLLHSGQKRGWLEHRQSTEQMRLFHYRSLIQFSHLIASGRREEFLSSRDRLFSSFEESVLLKPAEALQAIVGAQWSGDSLAPQVQGSSVPDNPVSRELLGAYRALRIERQINFTEYKLQRDGRVFSKFPRQQASWLELLSNIGLAGTIAVHGLIVVAAAIGRPEWVNSWVHVIGIWLAVAALALKTLQEGLQPTREVERYSHYQATLRALRDRFDEGATIGEKLATAAAIERAAADEMVIFLRAGSESRFVM